MPQPFTNCKRKKNKLRLRLPGKLKRLLNYGIKFRNSEGRQRGSRSGLRKREELEERLKDTHGQKKEGGKLEKKQKKAAQQSKAT